MRSKLHEIGAKMSTTYTTEQIARLAGLHPNTVRKYEERELIQKPQRKENGYRCVSNFAREVHFKQFEADLIAPAKTTRMKHLLSIATANIRTYFLFEPWLKPYLSVRFQDFFHL